MMWENIVELNRPQMTIWHMCTTCWMPEATDSLRICNTYCCSAATVVAQTCLNVTLYIHCLSCFCRCGSCGCSFGSSSSFVVVVVVVVVVNSYKCII